MPFAVPVQVGIAAIEGLGGWGEGFVDTQEVRHHDAAAQGNTAQRPVADGAEVLLELAGHAAFKGVMARVVGARCQLVDQNIAGAGQK